MRTGKGEEKLRNYQKYLLVSLMGIGDGSEVMVSKLKYKFYTYLEPFRKKVYDEMKVIGAIADDPREVVKKWEWKMGMAQIPIFVIVGYFWNKTGNFGPMGVLWIQVVLTGILMKFMPRKTAWGYSLHRQVAGLKYYLGVGKWRQEIAEKRLFVDEILPLAIALGVVDKLASDMKGLAIEPPEYFGGVTANTFAHDLNRFQVATVSGLTSSPQNYSGSGSWSGGSGFGGGGHSGGGFGGGGGGSW